ncbi:MAG: amidohydrolase family protein [Alistipes sp.]|nr:amidohydrolase family protein [Alistipes sp.]
MSRKIAAHYALIDGRLERNTIVEVDDERRIVRIEQCSDIDNRAGVEFYPGILIPGMVNAHCHLELSYLKGAIAEGTGFAGFARAIGSVRGNYRDEERITAAAKADATMWEEGVEAVLDIANDELVMGVKERSHIRYKSLFEIFGLTTTAINKHLAMAERHPHSSITPHSTYSLQDQVFKEACAANDSVISIHLLESDDEGNLYNKRGSLAEWYARMGWECDFLHYGTPARRIVESIVNDRRVVVVHGCKATAEDVARLDNHFKTAVSWVLCPESNRYISGIKPPVEVLRKAGAQIAIGSDSLSSARTLSLIDNLRQIDDIPLEELLGWATIGGAKALGMEDTIGSISVGKCPGLVIIEGADLHTMRLTEESHARRLL